MAELELQVERTPADAETTAKTIVVPALRPEPNRLAEATLNRHLSRKSQGIPSLPMLVGDLRQALPVFSRWTEKSLQRPLVLTRSLDQRGIVLAIAQSLWEGDDLLDRARILVNAAPEDTGRTLEAAVTREMRLDAWDQPGEPELAQIVGRRIVELAEAGDSPSPVELVRSLNRLLDSRGSAWWRVINGLASVVGPSRLPALGLCLDRHLDCGIARIAEVAREHHDLIRECPELFFAWICEAPVVFDYMRTRPDTRVKSLLREGVLIVSSKDASETLSTLPEIRDHAESFGEEPVEEEEIAPAQTARDQLVRAFSEAALAFCGDSAEFIETHTQDPALVELLINAALEDRGAAGASTGAAARKLLQGILEFLPETSELFSSPSEVTARGGESIAVDFLSEERQLVIQVEENGRGLAPERYAADRLEDLELQLAGYLVVRIGTTELVTATEEVVARLREICTRSLRTSSEGARS